MYCPLKYEPIEAFIDGIDSRNVDKSTEIWLDSIEESVHYGKWYCGHFHIKKRTGKIQFMYEDIETLHL